MFNNKSARGPWWACALLAVLLAAGCASAISEESGGGAPAPDSSGVGGGDGSIGGDVSGSVSASSVADSLPSPPGGVTTTVVEEGTTTTTTTTTTAVQVGEENGGGGEPLEPAGGIVPAEAWISEEGLEILRRVLGEDQDEEILGAIAEATLEKLRRVLGEDKLASVLETVVSLSWQLDRPGSGLGSGVLLGRLAGENGFFTEEGLSKLAERRSGETLVWAAYTYSEEELAEYANEGEERMVGPRYSEVGDIEGRFADEFSDETVKARAFSLRALADNYNRWWEDNDLSTPVGAFCWAVLHARHSEEWTRIGGGFRPWRSFNLHVWHLEREAEERGIELEWELPPLDADRTLRRVLLEAAAPEVRSVVFGSGLPSVLRPAAEALYSVYDELLALPVRRARPTVEELSEYRRLKDLTEEEIAQIWPQEFEIDYRDVDNAKYLNAMNMLRDYEVRGFLNAECKERPPESPCPPWEVSEAASVIWECRDGYEEMLEQFSSLSCPIFFRADITFYVADVYDVVREGLESECTSR